MLQTVMHCMVQVQRTNEIPWRVDALANIPEILESAQGGSLGPCIRMQSPGTLQIVQRSRLTGVLRCS